MVTERVGYFLKMVGPDKTMDAIRPAFDELISTLEVGEASKPRARCRVRGSEAGARPDRDFQSSCRSITIVCARCTLAQSWVRPFCVGCGLPLGGVQADAGAGAEALGTYEAPEPADPDVERLIREFVARSGFDVVPSSHGWRLTVPSRLDRKQAVYVGPAGTDAEGRALLALVSVCGPANDRDLRILLKLNARMTDGHFAIRVLRGEEYFVVIENLPVESAQASTPQGLVRRIAEAADGLEDRLSRGRDLY